MYSFLGSRKGERAVQEDCFLVLFTITMSRFFASAPWPAGLSPPPGDDFIEDEEERARIRGCVNF